MTDIELTKTYLKGRGIDWKTLDVEKFDKVKQRVCKTGYVVYKHIRFGDDTKKPFYVGLGRCNRPYDIGRNSIKGQEEIQIQYRHSKKYLSEGHDIHIPNKDTTITILKPKT